MPRSRIVRSLAVTAGFLTIPLVTVLPATAASASTSRSSTPAPTGIRKVQSQPRIPHGARSLGAVSSAAPVSGAVVLKPRDEAAVKSFISQVTDKNSPLFHHYLTPGAYAARFGPAPATVDAVKKALEADGLRVSGVASDGLVVNFSGTAAKAEQAFHTGINRYRLADGSTGQATTAPLQLPAAIAGSVSSVLGLDQLVHMHSADIRRSTTPSSTASTSAHPAARAVSFSHPTGSPTACADASGAAQEFGGLTDDQIANAYGAFGLYQNSDLGAGQHIAVFELEQFDPSDLQAFDTCYFGASEAATMAGTNGVAGGLLNVIPVDGGQPAGPGSGEAILDVEDVSAMAPQANIDVYEAPNTTFGAIDEFSQIINNTDPSTLDRVVTTSWGLCEQAVQSGEPGIQQAENLLFEQAAAQGQTVLSAAGDTGSNDCNANRTTYPVSPILSVDDPSSQPYVLAVGGTTMDAATQPPQEHVWNDGAAWGAGGGGISESWPMPNWQLDSQVPGIVDAATVSSAEGFEQNDLGNAGYAFCRSDNAVGLSQALCRQLPDVSAQADEFTGAITVYIGSYGGWLTIGGTSSATPIWAGLLALVNDSQTSPACRAPSTGIGFANPLLYAVASSPTAYAASFNDVTAGDNDPYGASNLFPATTGYDMASGLGTPLLTGPNGQPGLAYYLCNVASSTSRPTVTGLSPGVAPTSATDTPGVVVTGTGFEDNTNTADVAGVQVGGVEVPSGAFSVDSATQITVDFPPAAGLVSPGDPTDGAGGYQVTVTLDDGETSLASPNSLFEYVDGSGGSPVPAVTSVRTYAGPDAGGNVVDIFGTGFTNTTGVTFGGVGATAYTVLSDSHIQATAPPYQAGPTDCVQNGSTFDPSQSAANDICQTQVVVTNSTGSSQTSNILPLYEGAFDFNAAGVIPAPTGEEAAPQPDEYDYIPPPTIAAISTDQGPSSLASENGGTVVTIQGTGFNLATLDWLDVGDPTQQASQNFFNLLYVTGTEIQFAAPSLPGPTVDTTQLPVSVKTVAGQSTSPVPITYAGIPTVDAVVATAGPTESTPTAPDTGGTPIEVSGAGLQNQVLGLQFVDSVGPFSYGTQYNFTVNSDTDLASATVPQNPGVVDVQACTVTDCSPATSLDNPPSFADALLLFPPGDPTVDSVSPASGPVTGGTQVTITGQNLGCVTGVFFGSTPAQTFTNEQALLDCGSTTTVQVTAPPGVSGSTVPVTVTTVESDATNGPVNSNASFTYVGSPPAFTADTPPAAASTGRPYSYTFRASGVPAPTFSVSSGSLPAGLRLSSTTGALSGTPTAVGTWHFVVKASNSSGSATTPDLTITVKAGVDTGYRLFGTDGSVYAFGSEPNLGSLRGIALNKPVVGMASTPDTKGYWLVASDGGIFAFGDARFYGSTGGIRLNKPVVGMASTPDGKGYWLVASDGGIFSYGDAHFYGSTGNIRLDKPVVGMASTADGRGYWLVASDGGIFAFGDARFYGSTGGIPLVEPIEAMAPTGDGRGYWMVASDGGIFGFGDARFYGSLGGQALAAPVVGMAATPDGMGYALVTGNGQVTGFGDFAVLGSTAGQPIPAPIDGIST